MNLISNARARDRITILIQVISLLAVGAIVIHYLIAVLIEAEIIEPPGPHIICHKQIDGALEQWKLETTNGDWFPNVDGKSLPSLSFATNYIPDAESWFRDYRYVPGLNSTDSPELVLMYVKEPSWRRWHGDRRWFGLQKRWIVLNPQFRQGDDDKWSEVGEWIPTEEFTNRLAKTLDYLAKEKRPYFTNVIKEHAEFLRSLNAGR